MRNARPPATATAPKATRRLPHALACIFHGVAFERGSMGERFFVRLTTAWRAMPREENGKALASGPLSSAKARRSKKYKLDFTNLTFAKSENGNKKGPTHEICRLISARGSSGGVRSRFCMSVKCCAPLAGRSGACRIPLDGASWRRDQLRSARGSRSSDIATTSFDGVL